VLRERREITKRKSIDKSRSPDPAEQSAGMRVLYRGWRPTRLGHWMNRLNCWWSGLGAAAQVPGRLRSAGPHIRPHAYQSNRSRHGS
jgi:hypothetical protein